jgi:putative methyltransferase (TIGR04325 family)
MLGPSRFRLARLRERLLPRRYGSFEDAREACGHGYEEAALVDVVFRKTSAWAEALRAGALPPLPPSGAHTVMAVAAALASADGVPRVLDFGGGCGAAYFVAKAALGGVPLHWRVVETPAMAARARGLGGEELGFCESLEDALAQLGGVDVLHSSGTLHYLADPRGMLRELVGCGGRVLLLTRVATACGNDDVYGVQRSTLAANGPGPLPPGQPDAEVLYPFHLVPRAQLMGVLSGAYEVMLDLTVDGDRTPRLGGVRARDLAVLARRVTGAGA